MKYTLLEMTQTILSRMDSDEVDSIGDTVESMQVARVIRDTYFNILTRADLPEHKKLIQLTSSGSSSKPVQMIRPDNVRKIDWIMYDKRLSTDTMDRFSDVWIIPIQQFVTMVNALNVTDSNVDSMVINSITYNFRNDVAPSFCTVIDDVNIIFDAYDNTVDTTLQTSKTKCLAQTVPTFALVDGTIPDLDDVQFQLLLNEAASVAFVDLKQQANPKAETEARRQWRSLQRTKALTKVPTAFDSLPYYGRK